MIYESRQPYQRFRAEHKPGAVQLSIVELSAEMYQPAKAGVWRLNRREAETLARELLDSCALLDDEQRGVA